LGAPELDDGVVERPRCGVGRRLIDRGLRRRIDEIDHQSLHIARHLRCELRAHPILEGGSFAMAAQKDDDLVHAGAMPVPAAQSAARVRICECTGWAMEPGSWPSAS